MLIEFFGFEVQLHFVTPGWERACYTVRAFQPHGTGYFKILLKNIFRVQFISDCILNTGIN